MFQAEICHTNMSSKSERIQFCVFQVHALESIIYLYDEPTNACVYVQTYIIILHQNIPVTLVTIIRVLDYN